MAKRIRIKTSRETDVHFDLCKNSYTLCGLETMGDEEMEIKAGVRTKAKVTCKDCIEIVNYCKSINDNEFLT